MHVCFYEGGAKPRPRSASQHIEKQHFIKKYKTNFFTLFLREG